jgi:NADH:ubiquinone reductase (H+-translocating)
MADAKAKHHIVVLGAGVAGLRAAQGLAKIESVTVTLVSDKDTFAFLPRLTELLSETIPADRVLLPLRTIWKGRLVIDKAVTVQPSEKKVVLASGSHIEYDTLLIALGSQTNYFNTPGSQYSYPFYTREDEEKLKEHVDRMLEADEQPGTHTFAVVGGGPTGVEVSYVLAQRARKLRPGSKILLIEAGPSILRVLPPKLAQAAKEALERENITIITDTAVKNITPMSVDVELKEHGKETINCYTTVWAAGSKPQQLNIVNVELTPRGEIPVKPTLQSLADSSIFAIGDIAGANCPKTAQGAVQQADHVIENIRAQLRNTDLKPFTYNDKGTIIALEKNTVGVFYGKVMSGFLAQQVRDKYYRFALRHYKP